MSKYLDQTGLARYHGNVEKRPVQTFDTVAAMQAATYLEAGMTCHTNGNATIGDGDAAYYTVGTSGDIALQGGLYATQVNTGENHLGIMVLGDSYGEGYTPDGNVESWISYFNRKVPKYGYAVYSSALGGAGFYRDDATKKFSTLASNLIATLTAAQKESIGAVIVGGGYNDRTNTRANIYSGMVELRDIINNNLPNVRRVLIFPFGMGVQGLTTGGHAGFTYSTIVDMVKNYADANVEAQLGTIVGNSYMLLRRNVYFSSDYVHPNQSGNFLIGCFVSDVFFGNEESIVAKKFNDDYTPSITLNSGVTSDYATSGFRVYTSGSQMVLKMPLNTTFNFATTFNLVCDIQHPVTLGTFTDAAIQQYGSIVIPVSATVRSSTSVPLRYQQITGELVIDAGVMKFCAIATNSAGNGFVTVESVDRIQCISMGYPTFDGLTLIG